MNFKRGFRNCLRYSASCTISVLLKLHCFGRSINYTGRLLCYQLPRDLFLGSWWRKVYVFYCNGDGGLFEIPIVGEASFADIQAMTLLYPSSYLSCLLCRNNLKANGHTFYRQTGEPHTGVGQIRKLVSSDFLGRTVNNTPQEALKYTNTSWISPSPSLLPQNFKNVSSI